MIFLYYGPSAYCRNTKLKIKVKSVLDKNSDTSIKHISFEDEDAILLLGEAIGFRDLFSSGKKVNIIILSKTREIKNKDKKVVIELLKRCERDSNVFCYLNENIRKRIIPVYLSSLLKNIKYERLFFDVVNKNEALKYIKEDLEYEERAVNLDIISKLYDAEDGNLFSISNSAKKLSFLNYSSEKLINLISKEYSSNTTINDFSKALIYNNSLAYKLYMLENFFTKNSFYNGVIAYLSKATNNKELIKKLANEDIKIKSGLLDPDSAILELVLSN